MIRHRSRPLTVLDTAGHSSGAEAPCCHVCGRPTLRLDHRLRECSEGHRTLIQFSLDRRNLVKSSSWSCYWRIADGSREIPQPLRGSVQAIHDHNREYAASEWTR
jgi:hypothetical protein